MRLLNLANEPVSLKWEMFIGLLEEVSKDNIIDIQANTQDEKKKSDKKTKAHNETFIDCLNVTIN